MAQEAPARTKIDYHPDDHWHASAEGYAASTSPIPLHRVRRVGGAHQLSRPARTRTLRMIRTWSSSRPALPS